MKSVIAACTRALRDLAEPRAIAIIVLPVLAALAIWFVIVVWFWQSWVTAAGEAIGSMEVARWLRDWGMQWLLSGLGVMTVIALVIPALFITTVIITEIFAMPALVNLIGGRDFPALKKHSGGTTAGSILNAAVGITVFLLIFVLCLPLWFLGPVGLVAGAINSAYLAQRLFRYDALAEHATGDEYRLLVKQARGRLFLLGLTLAPLNYVPLLNLFAPVISGLAFTHLCLGELARLRSADAAPGATR